MKPHKAWEMGMCTCFMGMCMCFMGMCTCFMEMCTCFMRFCVSRSKSRTVVKTVPTLCVGGYCPGHIIVLKLADRMTSDFCILY